MLLHGVGRSQRSLAVYGDTVPSTAAQPGRAMAESDEDDITALAALGVHVRDSKAVESEVIEAAVAAAEAAKKAKAAAAAAGKDQNAQKQKQQQQQHPTFSMALLPLPSGSPQRAPTRAPTAQQAPRLPFGLLPAAAERTMGAGDVDDDVEDESHDREKVGDGPSAEKEEEDNDDEKEGQRDWPRRRCEHSASSDGTAISTAAAATSTVTAAAVDDDPLARIHEGSGGYSVGYAPASRAKCSVCKLAFSPRELRIGQETREAEFGVVIRWRHARCVQSLPRRLACEQIEGFDALAPPDQERITRLLALPQAAAAATVASSTASLAGPAAAAAATSSAAAIASGPGASSVAAMSTAAAAAFPAAESSKREEKQRATAQSQEEADAALARALASQRSERLSVARKRHERQATVVLDSDEDDDEKEEEEEEEEERAAPARKYRVKRKKAGAGSSGVVAVAVGDGNAASSGDKKETAKAKKGSKTMRGGSKRRRRQRGWEELEDGECTPSEAEESDEEEEDDDDDDYVEQVGDETEDEDEDAASDAYVDEGADSVVVAAAAAAPSARRRKKRRRKRHGDDDDDDGDDDDMDYVDDGEEEEEEEEEEDVDVSVFGLGGGGLGNGRGSGSGHGHSRGGGGSSKPLGQRARRAALSKKLEQSPYGSSDDEAPDEALVGELKAPGRLWKRLHEHQRVCLEWLCGLHRQEVGGVLGDDMGLGKTLQIVALFSTLHHSRAGGACLVVAPATVLRQWKREVNRWAPEISRVVVLHSSSGVDPNGRVRAVREVCSENDGEGSRMAGDASVLITSYEMMRQQAAVLLAQRWQYVVLDEGHKIRNPDAEVTLIAKRFHTGHRIILTGAPIQNKLTELWSLFDFVFPGRLGTLPTFQEQFSMPISLGAYANASTFKVQAAYQCSVILRDLIRPYLLRRTKADVSLNLPTKSEQVLFCQLTDAQRDAYEHFLRSDLVRRVLAGRANAFAALTSLLKICNHPHLLNWDEEAEERAGLGREGGSSTGPSGGKDARYGDPTLSGKMAVLKQVLKMWHAKGDRALLFTQTRQMLDILQAFVMKSGYSFRRLDGMTPVGTRLALIDEYNADEEIFCFLLTTRAGGLGVNLTGANRVLLMDPDWNPANDMQARERAYRIGQTRNVTVYRLVTAGTLEEKVYQRQIFKQVMANNVLKDPKQTRRVFKPRDLKDLLAPPTGYGAADGTETADLFQNAEHVAEAEPAPATTTKAQQGGGLSAPARTPKAAAAASAATKTAAAASAITERAAAAASVEESYYDEEGGEGYRPPAEGAAASSSSRFGRLPRARASAEGADSRAVVPSSAAPSQQRSDSPPPAPPAEKSETGFLSQLLRGELVASALDHDVVLGDAAKTAPGRTAVKEARKVAERAAASLKESFERRQRERLSVPTWTGRSGSAGLPNKRPTFGGSLNPTLVRTAIGGTPSSSAASNEAASSASPAASSSFFGHAGPAPSAAPLGSAALLQRIRERQDIASGLSGPDAEATRLLKRLCEYFRAQPGGKCTSEQLVGAFKGAEVDARLFKQLLKEAASKDARGVWRLKPEYDVAA